MAGFDFGRIITLSLFAATLRMTTPVLFATLGGIFSSQVGIFNVGLEALLDIGAFFAVVGSVQTGSPWGGLLCTQWWHVLLTSFGICCYPSGT